MICIDHFEEKFIIKHETKMTLNYSMRSIPNIHPSFIPSSLAPIPSESRKVPQLRIYQPDELQSFNRLLPKCNDRNKNQNDLFHSENWPITPENWPISALFWS